MQRSSKKWLILNPTTATAGLALVPLCSEAGAMQKSLAAFRRALIIQPGSAVGYCNMSLALSGLGRTDGSDRGLPQGHLHRARIGGAHLQYGNHAPIAWKLS